MTRGRADTATRRKSIGLSDTSPRPRVAVSLRRILTVFLLLFLAWIFLAPLLAENLIVEKPLKRADAILILSGSSVYLERTEKAAEQFKQGVAAKIVLTDDGEQAGWSRAEKRNISYVELAQRNLVAQDVPAESIEIIKPNGSGTIYEAQAFKEKARQANLKSVLLVTSAYHTRRTVWTFERVFENENIEFGIAAPPPGKQTPSPAYWWLTPRGWSLGAGEYVKSFYYWTYY